MKMLVTGGAGFIGSYVTDKLIERGNEVIILDNLSTGSIENVNKKAIFIEGDISKMSDVEMIFSRYKIDMVFHLAAQIDVRISTENPQRDAKTNIIGTINILDTIKKYNTKKIIFSSTGGALYGEVDKPADEDYDKNPEAPYGISKFSAEMYIKFYSENYGLNYTILRYANVYGPRQSTKGEAGVVAIFANNMKHNKESILFGFGEMYRDYVYVLDVAKTNVLSVDRGDREIYNVGTGVRTSVSEIFNALNLHFINYTIAPKLLEKRKGEIQSNVVSPKKIIKDYKISFTPLEEGIKKTVEFFKEKE